MSRRRHKPVSTIPVSADITGLSHDGRGIASIQGKTTFIAGALPGEKVMFKYLRHHSRFDEGQTIDVLSPSPERVTPNVSILLSVVDAPCSICLRMRRFA